MLDLQLRQSLFQFFGDKLALQEVIKLHVNYSSIDPFDRGGVAHSTFHTITATNGVAAMDTTKSDLAHSDSMFTAGSRGINITFSGFENFNILLHKKKE